jgi:hypothetical protein
MYNKVKNVELELNHNSGEILSENEVSLTIHKCGELDIIEAGLPTIPGKPIPFSTTHPDGGFKGKDPVTVFNQDIKSAGTMGDAWIDYIDQPKIRAKIDITDPEIKVLIKQDKVLISYVYWRDQSSHTIYSFDFDHLLIYRRKGGM